MATRFDTQQNSKVVKYYKQNPDVGDVGEQCEVTRKVSWDGGGFVRRGDGRNNQITTGKRTRTI